MKIAVDAMGGDNAPHEIVKGVITAASFVKGELILVGDETKIKPLIHNKPHNVSIVHTDEYIEMDENPTASLRRKKNASIIVAAKLVKNKEADALISAGNTGALLEASLLHMGRIKSAKIKRPALSVVLPTYKKPTILLDAGANSDCKPEYLLQFAKMGMIYSKYIIGLENPTVGLINIGSEPNKGNSFSLEAFELLSNAGINFVGNVESGAIFRGQVDVAVADGFTGNIVLKTAESAAELINKLIKDIVKSNPIYLLGALLFKGVFQKLKSVLDHSEHGGALLFGVDGICIKAHGRAKFDAIVNAIKLAQKMSKTNIIAKFTEEMNTDYTLLPAPSDLSTVQEENQIPLNV